MQKDIEKFEKAGIQLVGISYDKVEILKEFSEKKDISFPLLSDVESKTIRELDIEDKNGLPHSGTMLVDKENKVRAKIFYDGYRKRHPNEELLQAAESAGLPE